MRSHRPLTHRPRSLAAVGARLATPVAALAALVLLTGCGGSKPGNQHHSSGPPSTAASGAATVEVKNFSFTPMSLAVHTGATVTWKFDDSAAHTVKADDGAFASPSLSGGKTYTFTFKKAGTYHYICSIHQYMTGTITVS